MRSFLDEQGLLNLDEVIARSPSFQQIMEDGIVTEEELKLQSDRVMALIEKVQQMCSEEQLVAVKELIAEMNVLYVAYHYMNLKTIGDR